MEEFSEKSEKPTAKRLKKAKKEGEFAYSPKFASTLFMCIALLLIALYSLWLIPVLKQIFFDSFSSLSTLCHMEKPFHHIFSIYLPLIKMISYLIVFLAILLFIAHSWQSGFAFSFTKPKKMQGGHYCYLFFYTLITCVLTLLLGYVFITAYTSFPFAQSSEKQISFLTYELFFIAIKSLPFFLLVTFCDYLIQRQICYKRMHMTKQEIKEEIKEEQVKRKMSIAVKR